MKLPVFTVTQKVAAGYLLLVCFSLVALLFALNSLRAQTERSEQLVSVDFKVLQIARSLHQGLDAHEHLARQTVVLRDAALLPLLERREEELFRSWEELQALWPVPDHLSSAYLRAQTSARRCMERLNSQQWNESELCLTQELAPPRTALNGALDLFIEERQQALDNTLVYFSEASARAYRITLTLAFLGIGFSAPVAMTVILGLHRSIRALTRATKEVASGSFEHPVEIDRGDEFGHLAREFTVMGRKLRQLEQLRLDANPLTHLPGNLALDREMTNRIAAGHPFAHLYIDLDHFKAYNDRYGYRAGSEVISRVANLARDVLAESGCPDAVLGHIGGDDFVILVASPEEAEAVARELIVRFDRCVPDFYSEEDRQAGFFIALDRFGEERRFELMTVSIAIVWSGSFDAPSPQGISRECGRIKDHLKRLPGSNYMIDRRRTL